MGVSEKALAFLREHNEAAFATVEDGKPRIRVLQIMRIEGETLYFATAPHKEVYRQLQANPNVELLAMAGNLSVRVTGSAVFDVPDEVARAIYAENPVLPRLYKAYSDLAYFRLPIETLAYYDLSPTPPLLAPLHSERYRSTTTRQPAARPHCPACTHRAYTSIP